MALFGTYGKEREREGKFSVGTKQTPNDAVSNKMLVLYK